LVLRINYCLLNFLLTNSKKEGREAAIALTTLTPSYGQLLLELSGTIDEGGYDKVTSVLS